MRTVKVQPAQVLRNAADKLVCQNCVHEFGKSPDCGKCVYDAESRFAQDVWWKEAPHLMFMGVNLGECLAQDARGYVGFHNRMKEELDDARGAK